MIDLPLFLRTVFRAGDAGITSAEVARALDLPVEAAEAVLHGLFKTRKLARIPNPRGRGLAWRIPKRGDVEAGFIWEASGDPKVTRNDEAERKRKRGQLTKATWIPEPTQ